jgi:hypothetical protein
MIKVSDLEMLLDASEQILLMNKRKMPKRWYDLEDPKNIPIIEDQIDYIADDGTVHKLFLDRFVYSKNFKDYILVRFTSADQSIIEEWKDLVDKYK